MGQESGCCTLPLHPDARCCPHSPEALFTAEDAAIQLSVSNTITALAHTVLARPL